MWELLTTLTNCNHIWMCSTCKGSLSTAALQFQLFCFFVCFSCWDSMYSRTKHVADLCLAAPKCSLRWLNQTSLIVYTAMWLLATVMPIHTERPFVFSSDFQVPATCVEIMNPVCTLIFYSFLDLGNHVCEVKPAHLQTWHFLSWIRRRGRGGGVTSGKGTLHMNCDL